MAPREALGQQEGGIGEGERMVVDEWLASTSSLQKMGGGREKCGVYDPWQTNERRAGPRSRIAATFSD